MITASAPDGVLVVIPARNEERSLPRCLDAVCGAVQRLTADHPRVRLSITVVLDSCTDASARVVEDYPCVRPLRVDHASVGRARHAGIEQAMRQSDPSLANLWIANTDADTEVPPNWLVEQFRLASTGFQLVLGTVTPDRRGLSRAQHQAWQAAHCLREGHGHIHGANLGFRADRYLAVGGFAAMDVHEDVDLVERMKADGVTWKAVDSLRAITSARIHGRAPGGFAGYLRGLPH